MAKMITPAMIRYEKRNPAAKREKETYSFLREAWKRLRRNRPAMIGMCIIAVMILAGILADLITVYDPVDTNPLSMYARPSAEHPFGCDSLGRDLFSRCVYGARYSIPIGLACMAASLITGGFLGLLAAFFGSKADMIIMRVMDIFQSIPSTLMAITIVATVGTGIPQLILAIAISNMPAMAKIVRASILTVRSNEYIEAGRCIGASNLRLMFKHMLPNALGSIIIYAVNSIAMGIMVVATMSYIGLGVQAPAPEWGSLLSTGKNFLTSYPHMVLFPGIMIALTVLGFNLFGDGLRDALDPRLK